MDTMGAVLQSLGCHEGGSTAGWGPAAGLYHVCVQVLANFAEILQVLLQDEQFYVLLLSVQWVTQPLCSTGFV